MLFRPKRYTVFAGPSVESLAYRPHWATFRAPIGRDDLLSTCRELDPKRDGILIVDGVFGDRLALTNTECRVAMEQGFVLAGSSSIGALRAADCWNLGMMGFGYVFESYRSAKVKDDSDVAVRYSEDYRTEVTLSGVRLRFMVKKLVEQNSLSVVQGRRFLHTALSIPWYERLPITIEQISEQFSISSADFKILLQPQFNPKVLDVQHALMALSPVPW